MLFLYLSCPATTSFPPICGVNYLTFVFFLRRIKNDDSENIVIVFFFLFCFVLFYFCRNLDLARVSSGPLFPQYGLVAQTTVKNGQMMSSIYSLVRPDMEKTPPGSRMKFRPVSWWEFCEWRTTFQFETRAQCK